MEQKLEGLNIIDLISEKHIVLRREAEDRWAENEKEEITHTEGFLLAKIRMEKVSLARVAKQANISRQAMFKCAKKLEEKGYLEFISEEGSGKYAVLTKKGEEYCRRSQALKMQIEEEIVEVLGEEKVMLLKDLLKKEWLVK
ncbi:MAG: MarR family transcriptional regulator [Cellulosilyticum sp.]|nr:MarR family transcriptional regulator [Cellulosilyticum sp.]